MSNFFEDYDFFDADEHCVLLSKQKMNFKEVIIMKISKIFIAVMAAMLMTASVQAAEIPRESAPLNATEEQIVIVENIIGDILDEVAAGNMGYTEAVGKANTRVRKAVVAEETNGYGYGILSPIAQNAVLDIRDMYLRPEAYAQAEEYLKVLLADLITAVENGMDPEEARKQAYERIYMSIDPEFDPTALIWTDFCYLDIPTVDRALFTTARKLLTNESM